MPYQRRSTGGRKRKPDAIIGESTASEAPLKIRYVDKDGISDNLRCTICQDIFSYPIALMCGHVFCNGCIRDWLVNNRKDTCPECRTPANIRNSHKDMIAHKFLDSVSVYCTYLGCAWVGRMDELESHAKHCEFNPTKLPTWMVSKSSDTAATQEDRPAEGTTSLRMRLFKNHQNEIGSAASGKLNIFSLSNVGVPSGPKMESLESLTSDLVRSQDIINRNREEDFISISDSDST